MLFMTLTPCHTDRIEKQGLVKHGLRAVVDDSADGRRYRGTHKGRPTGQGSLVQ